MWTAILNALGWVMLKLYELVNNYGLAIILFTLFSKVILLPFAMKSKKSMLRMSAFQPKMKAIEEKYKNDKDRYNQEIQKLYKEEKVNPLGGCLWTLLPWPIFIALYGVMRLPLTHMLGITADEITAIQNLPVILNSGVDLATVSSNQLPLMNAINANFDAVVAALPALEGRLVPINFDFFGMNLSAIPNWQYLNPYWFLPIISAAAMWFSSFILQKMQGQPQTDQQNGGSMKFMVWFGPIMSLMIGFSWPASMSFYWIANSLLSTAQDAVLTIYYRKKLNIKSPKELREEHEAEIAEAKRRAEERAARLERLQTEGPKEAKKGQMSSKKYKALKAQQTKAAAPSPTPTAELGEPSDSSDDADGITEDNSDKGDDNE